MSWNFQLLGEERHFSYAYANPADGSVEEFTVEGFDTTNPNRIRAKSVSIQLAGVSRVEYPTRSVTYTGFNHINKVTNTKNEYPRGVARSTAVSGLEYLCVLMKENGPKLDYEISEGSVSEKPADGPVYFIPLEGPVQHMGKTVDRLQCDRMRGAITAQGKVLLIFIDATERNP